MPAGLLVEVIAWRTIGGTAQHYSAVAAVQVPSLTCALTSDASVSLFRIRHRYRQNIAIWLSI